MEGCGITGACPRHLPSGLITLTLARNQVSGTIPPTMLDERHMEMALIDLSLNTLSGSIPVGFARSSTLKHILLNSMALSGSLPVYLGSDRSYMSLQTLCKFLSAH